MKLKYLVNVIVCGSVIICAVPVYAAKGGIKGHAVKAYEHASDNVSFKRVDGNQLKKENKELKKLDKELDEELKHSDKDDKDKGKKDKDTQLEKSLNKELKKAARKAIK